jgi:hypothetical protein
VATDSLEGTEFDWFAVDQDGKFALFATAGSGPVPFAVASAAEEHEKIGSALQVSCWGSIAVWESYSRVGLYGYDWSSQASSYIRVAEPSSPLSQELSTRLTTCAAVHKFVQISFDRNSAVRPDWLGAV